MFTCLTHRTENQSSGFQFSKSKVKTYLKLKRRRKRNHFKIFYHEQDVNKCDTKIQGIQQISKNSNYFGDEVEKKDVENVKKCKLMQTKVFCWIFFSLFYSLSNSFRNSVANERKKIIQWNLRHIRIVDIFTSYWNASLFFFSFISLNKSPKSRPHFKAIQFLDSIKCKVQIETLY